MHGCSRRRTIPGYLGEQNSLSEGETTCELVTVFAFDSRRNLERWERSTLRIQFLAELDRHPQESSKHTTFDDLARLLHPRSHVSKIEVVLILIFWIVVLGGLLDYLADIILPGAVPPMARSVLLISVNVILISYVFLPRTSMALTRLKMRLSAARKGRRGAP
ncbi:hypothetical protein [Roseivivax sp. CAU 1753]